MAYFTQEMKKVIAAKLKTVVPKGWKYTLRVRDHSTLTMVVSQLPETYKLNPPAARAVSAYGNYTIARSHSSTFEDPKHEEALDAIWGVLNERNYDKSDSQVDYFEVGYYCYIDLGRWDKPLKFA